MLPPLSRRFRALAAVAAVSAFGGPRAAAQAPPGQEPDIPPPPASPPAGILTPAPPDASPRTPPTPAELDRRLREQEDAMDELRAQLRKMEAEREAGAGPAGGILTRNQNWLQIGGLLRLEYVDVENEQSAVADATDDPSGHFRLNRFRLWPRVTMSRDIQLDVQVDLTGGAPADPNEQRALVKQAWVTFRDLPAAPVWIEAGLRQRFIKPVRKTETVPLAGAFWRDDDLGVTAGADLGAVYARAGVYNGMALDDGPIGRDDSFFTLRDQRSNRDRSSRKELAAGLGTVMDLGGSGKVDLLGFGYVDKLSHPEAAFLRTLPTYGLSEEDAQHRYGANLDWTLGDANVFAQVIRASDGRLRRTGWYVQPSYTLPLPEWTRSRTLVLLYRYDGLDLNLDAANADSRTWDRRRNTLAALVEVTRDVTVKFEYNVNNESTGGNQIDNDEFIAQLEVRF